MENTENLLKNFINKFPNKNLSQSLTLEKYTNTGENRDDFTYWIEQKTECFGSIWGGSSYKFGIYKYIKTPPKNTSYVFDNEYAWSKKYGELRNDAFKKIKQEIQKVADAAADNTIKYDTIEKADLGDAYKWKIAFLYSNNRLIPVYKKEVLRAAAEKLGVCPKNTKKVTVAQLQEKLVEYYDKNTSLYNNNICDFGNYVWKIGKTETTLSEYNNMKNNKKIEATPTFNDDTKYHHSLNLILYGPPGTGKTYNTVNKALDIVNPNWLNEYNDNKTKGSLAPDIKNERDYALAKFRKYMETGQIVFTTFHQSMSYEDFIEGIKPQTEAGNVTYEVQPGIFKQICEKAKRISVVSKSEKIDFNKTRIFKMSLGEKGKDADSVFRYCVDNEVVSLGWGGAVDFSKCKKRADFQKLDSTWGASALEIFKEWIKTGDIVLVSDGTKEVKGIAQVTGDYEFRDDPSIDMHQFRKVKWLYTGDNIPISKLYDKNLSMQSIYGFYKEKKGVVSNGGIKVDVLNEIITGEVNEKEQEKYVLIIDEINRGNVSQIFGELITLIEESKRLGNAEEMKVTLPYSPDKGLFGVPNNLYIIGTMNTADRSVEALDTALRRRFSFEEMMPKPKLLEDKEVCGVKLSDLLTTINNRIVVLKDREHQIGHSYFMGCPTDDDPKEKERKQKEWLKDVFKDTIIPLLQEYFYGDYKKIFYVLGPGFVEKKTEKTIFAVDSDVYELDIPDERYDIVSFDTEFKIENAIENMKVQKTEADKVETKIPEEVTKTEESTDKK